jgi:peptidoglycan/LPS O-acetylase OafA/YrhL
VWKFSRPSGDSALFQYVANMQADLAFGVTLFFALSGFLLYRPFAAALMRAQPRPSFSRYLRNRALRIAPAYWVILLVSALVLGTTSVRNSAGQVLLNQRIDDPITLGEHLLLVQGYDPSTVATGIGPAWSLGVEVVFYVALPFLALFAWSLARRATTRSGRRLAALMPALLLLAVGLAGKMSAIHILRDTQLSGGWGGDWHSVLVRSFLGQADLFSFGMALAVARVDSEDGLLRVSALGRKGIAALCVASYLVVATRTDAADHLGTTPYNTLMALACALFLGLVVLVDSSAERPALVRVLELRPMVALGLVSYSLFLWHEPLIGWLGVLGVGSTGKAGFVVTVLLTLGVGFVFSVLTYRLVELPALRRKRRARSDDAALPLGAPAQAA